MWLLQEAKEFKELGSRRAGRVSSTCPFSSGENSVQLVRHSRSLLHTLYPPRGGSTLRSFSVHLPTHPTWPSSGQTVAWKVEGDSPAWQAEEGFPSFPSPLSAQQG